MDFNYLMNDPPTELEVGDVFYPIDSDYRNCLTIIKAFEDNELTDGEKIFVMLDRLYVIRDKEGNALTAVPDNQQEAAEKAVWFLNCADSMQSADTGRIYSLDKDSKWIRSAFEKTYGILFSESYLKTGSSYHWWEFCYKFLDLDDNSFFIKLMGIRARLNKGGKYATEEDKQFRRNNPELFNLSKKEISMQSALELEKELISRQKGGG